MTRISILCAGLSLLSLAGCEKLDPDIRKAKQAVRDIQKDPDAAQFRDVRKCASGFYVTGLVNGKNSYGAYTGFRRFYAIGGHAHIVEDDDSMDDFYRGQCYGSSESAEAGGQNAIERAESAISNAEKSVQTTR